MTDENKEKTVDMSKLSLAEKKVFAKEEYYRYAKITDIARKCHINLATLKTWVYGTHSKTAKGWKVERDLAKSQVLKDLTADKRGMVYNMVNGAMFLLHDFIEEKKEDKIKNNKTISLREAEKITNILGNLHRMIMDESSDADADANFKKPTSIKEIGKRIKKADPFMKDEIVIVESKEVVNEKSGTDNDTCDDDDIILD